MANPHTHDEPPEKGTIHETDVVAHAHDDHGHGHGHGLPANIAIIPEDSGADKVLTYFLPALALLVMVVFTIIMVTTAPPEAEAGAAEPQATTTTPGSH